MKLVSSLIILSSFLLACGSRNYEKKLPIISNKKLLDASTASSSLANTCKRAKARLNEPYILAGEDVESIFLDLDISFEKKLDLELINEVRTINRTEIGSLYFFISNLSGREKTHPHFIKLIKENKVIESPAIKVTHAERNGD